MITNLQWSNYSEQERRLIEVVSTTFFITQCLQFLEILNKCADVYWEKYDLPHATGLSQHSKFAHKCCNLWEVSQRAESWGQSNNHFTTKALSEIAYPLIGQDSTRLWQPIVQNLQDKYGDFLHGQQLPENFIIDQCIHKYLQTHWCISEISHAIDHSLRLLYGKGFVVGQFIAFALYIRHGYVPVFTPRYLSASDNHEDILLQYVENVANLAEKAPQILHSWEQEKLAELKLTGELLLRVGETLDHAGLDTWKCIITSTGDYYYTLQYDPVFKQGRLPDAAIIELKQLICQANFQQWKPVDDYFNQWLDLGDNIIDLFQCGICVESTHNAGTGAKWSEECGVTYEHWFGMNELWQWVKRFKSQLTAGKATGHAE